MESFSSSWIIKPTESGNTQLSLPPQKRSPSPTLSIDGPLFVGPAPPRRREHFLSARGHCCECDGNGNHDDVFPHFLKDYPPYPKDYPPYPLWYIFSQGNFPSRHAFDGRPRAHSFLPPHQYLTVNHGQSCRSRFLSPIQRSFTEIAEEETPPPPHREPYSHYSTHFPSCWLLSEAAGSESQENKRPLSSASFTSTRMGRPQFKSRPMPTPPLEATAASSQAKAPSPLPSGASKVQVELPIRNSTQQLVGAVTTSVDPELVASTSGDGDARTWNIKSAELDGESPQVDKGEQIGIWVERVSRHGSFPSTTNTVVTSLGAALDEDTMAKVVGFDIDISMDCFDGSGLGDAPHVAPGMQENYSVYSESTNKAEQAAKDG